MQSTYYQIIGAKTDPVPENCGAIIYRFVFLDEERAKECIAEFHKECEQYDIHLDQSKTSILSLQIKF